MENFKLTGDFQLPEYSVKLKNSSEAYEIYSLSLEFPQKCIPQRLQISWFEPNRDAYSVWAPWHMEKRELFPSWRRSSKISSDSNHGMPVFQFNDKPGNNICCIALSDVSLPCEMDCGIDERSGNISVRINLFTYPTEATDCYKTDIFISKVRKPYYEVLKDVSFWWLEKYSEAYVPEAAKHRTYSSWYKFQKDINATGLYKQCVLAKSYGMNTVIIDDGWQTPVCNQSDNAYITNGDWEPYEGKFPDFGGFVAQLHKIDMKVVLWIATAFVGSQSKYYEKLFKDRILRSNSDDGTVVVPDPRYPEIRKWYTELLTDRLTRWKLDGFKLDFIDCFEYGSELAPVKPGMDIQDINKATDCLLKEITVSLKALNPEVIIEFRQGYIGPIMKQYGNMLRVDDCAYGAMYNRINGIDLRLMSVNSAIHSDMLMWDYNASVEAAADQLSALLFIVPQISMDFEKLNDLHKKMLRYYLDFIDSNTTILLDGKLVPLYPESDYPVIYAEKDGKVICGLYAADSFCLPEGTSAATVINASGAKRTYIDISQASLNEKKYRITDCMGQTVSEAPINSGLLSFSIPWNGFLYLK